MVVDSAWVAYCQINKLKQFDVKPASTLDELARMISYEVKARRPRCYNTGNVFIKEGTGDDTQKFKYKVDELISSFDC